MEAEKSCIVCGADVTHQRRHKNRHGQYLCLPCHHDRDGGESPHSTRRSESLRRCVCCGVEVSRRDCHKNRYGEYICRVCRESGKRSSRRRLLGSALRRMAVLTTYLGLLAVGSWVFFQVMDRLQQSSGD